MEHTGDLIIAGCMFGIIVASGVWLNLYVADFMSRMTPEERRRFEEEAEEDIGF